MTSRFSHTTVANRPLSYRYLFLLLLCSFIIYAPGVSSISLGSIRILYKLRDTQAVLSTGKVLSFENHIKLKHATTAVRSEIQGCVL